MHRDTSTGSLETHNHTALKKIFTAIMLLSVSVSAWADTDSDGNATSYTPDSLSMIVADSISSLKFASYHPIDSKNTNDSIAFEKLSWWEQLWVSGFHIHDPRIKYPSFPKFLLNVYDWADKTFNSYDTDYVIGTGCNWKTTLTSYNWMESYMMLFSMHSRDMLHIRSSFYSDLGLHLSFMAVTLGYYANFNRWVGDKDLDRKTFNLNFTCSRFSASLDFRSTKGNTLITHFGAYNPGHSYAIHFDDIEHKSSQGQLYYFFNYRKYSQAAAYSYSKYQLKSAGTPILGFAFNHQNLKMDFSSLPEQMKLYLPSLENQYKFRFTDYGILAGYGYNYVIRPRKWLFNITAIPSVGYRHSYSDSSEGRKDMLSANIRARLALVYNYRALFATLTGKLDANLYFNSRYTFFNSVESLSFIVGARF